MLYLKTILKNAFALYFPNKYWQDLSYSFQFQIRALTYMYQFKYKLQPYVGHIVKYGLNDFITVLFYPQYYLSLSHTKRCQRLFFQSVHLHSELSLISVYNFCVRALKSLFFTCFFTLAPQVHQRLKCCFQSSVEVCRNIEVCCVLSVSDGRA